MTTAGNLTGLAKRKALHRAIQSSPEYAEFRRDIDPGFDIATATMERLETAYQTLYSFPFAGGAHDDPALVRDVLDKIAATKKSADELGAIASTGDARGTGREGDEGATGEATDGSGDGAPTADTADAGETSGDADSDAEREAEREASEQASRDADKRKAELLAKAEKLSGMDKAIVDLMREFMPAMVAPAVDAKAIEKAAEKAARKVAAGESKPVRLEISRGPELPTITTDRPLHYRFPLLLAAMNARVNLMLVGDAGSGKTSHAEIASGMLDLPFGMTGQIGSEYKLLGHIAPDGAYVQTECFRRYSQGGTFLFDEYDGSLPNAVNAFNAMLANGYADFPCGMVKRNPDFIALAAANTTGRGADRRYVGRMQQDAAALDRWPQLVWDYDIGLEATIVGLPRPKDSPAMATVAPITDEKDAAEATAAWFQYVLTIRAKAERAKSQIIVSPRATIVGRKLLLAGWPHGLVEDAVIWKGIAAAEKTKILAA